MVTRVVGTTKWRLPHRFFVKSHLRAREGVHEILGGTADAVLFGCVLCDGKGEVRNFGNEGKLMGHVRDEHDEEGEIDIERAI